MFFSPHKNAPATALWLLPILLASPIALASKTEKSTIVEEVFIRGEKDTELREDSASAATLTIAPLKEIPLNIAVIPRGVLDLKNATATRDIIEQSASVVTGTGHSRAFERVFIRGFRSDAELNATLKNGVPFYGTDSPAADPSALQSVEVLKGAAGLLYGAAQPGGVINYVYRKPQQEAAYSIKSTFGSFGTRRMDLDATGGLGTDLVSYRFTLGLEDSDSWQDYVFSKKLAPTFQLNTKIGSNTSLSLLAELIRIDNNPAPADTLLDPRNGEIIELPIETFLGHNNDFSDGETEQLQVQLDHAFNDSISLVAQIGTNTTQRDQGNTGYFAFRVPAEFFNPEAVPRLVFDQRRTSDGEYAGLHLTLDKHLGNFRHRALIGVNTSENNMTNHNGFSPLVPAEFQSPIAPINIFNPQTTSYPHVTLYESSPPFSILDWIYKDQGLNLQDLMTYEPWGLHILIGLRYGDFETTFNSDTSHTGELREGRTSTDNSEWIPRIGAVWDVNSSFSLYSSYGESYNSQFSSARDVNGNPITEPETGKQFELGSRWFLLENKLALTIAAYEITKENVVVSTETPQVSALDGEQQSRGFEFDVAGELPGNVDIYLSYAHTDTEVLESGTGGTEGNRFAAIPKNKLVIWTEWAFSNRWSLAYGLDYQSDSAGDNGNTFETPSRTLHELQLRSQWQVADTRLNADLAVKNISDEVWYQNNTSSVFIKRGQPRGVYLTLSANY